MVSANGGGGQGVRNWHFGIEIWAISHGIRKLVRVIHVKGEEGEGGGAGGRFEE